MPSKHLTINKVKEVSLKMIPGFYPCKVPSKPLTCVAFIIFVQTDLSSLPTTCPLASSSLFLVHAVVMSIVVLFYSQN